MDTFVLIKIPPRSLFICCRTGMDLVFDQQWELIQEFLDSTDLQSLIRACPVFAIARCRRFESKKKQLMKFLIPTYSWESIEEYTPVHRRLRIYFTARAPQDAEQVANRIVHFKRDRGNLDRRKQDLADALMVWNLPLRNDSQFCKKYYEGLEDIDLEEVVAITRLTAAQFEHGHICWSTNHVFVSMLLRKLVWNHGVSWDDAFAKAKSTIIVPSYTNGGYYDDDEDDEESYTSYDNYDDMFIYDDFLSESSESDSESSDSEDDDLPTP